MSRYLSSIARWSRVQSSKAVHHRSKGPPSQQQRQLKDCRQQRPHCLIHRPSSIGPSNPHLPDTHHTPTQSTVPTNSIAHPGRGPVSPSQAQSGPVRPPSVPTRSPGPNHQHPGLDTSGHPRHLQKKARPRHTPPRLSRHLRHQSSPPTKTNSPPPPPTNPKPALGSHAIPSTSPISRSTRPSLNACSSYVGRPTRFLDLLPPCFFPPSST